MNCKGCKNLLPNKAEDLKYCVYCGRRIRLVPRWIKWTSILGVSGVVALLVVKLWPQPGSSPVTLSPGIDLTVADIGCSPVNPSIGETATCTIVLYNAGETSSGSSTVCCYVDGSTIDSDTVPSMAPGGEWTLTFLWLAQAGAHTLVAVADCGSSVAESDEGNNRREVAVTVAVEEKPPTITSITPRQGTPGQAFHVTIIGANLTGATTAEFGDGITPPMPAAQPARLR